MNVEKIHITRVRAEADADCDFEQWLTKVKSFTSASLCAQWWVGDLLNIGEERWADQYQQIVNDLGVEYQTLKNWKWVAKNVAPEIRREELTWQHHLFVASLGPKDQQTWLDRAVSKKMSSGDLRSAIKTKNQREAEKRRAEEDEQQDDQETGIKRYRVILVNPNWRELSVEHLAELRLPADQESACLLVVPANKVREGVLLFENWNFVLATTAILIYPKVIEREWFRTSHDVLLFGVRGDMRCPPAEKTVSSVINCKSAGTDVLYDVLELMFPAKNKKKVVRCDLFGQEEREGWDCPSIPVATEG